MNGRTPAQAFIQGLPKTTRQPQKETPPQNTARAA
jgi:hypothetical protein